MRLSKLASLAVLTSLARANDIDTIYERQVKFILSKVKPSSTKIQQYITTLQPTGSWTTIDYTAGCAARRSSWPAGGHWQRILEMSAAFSTPGPHFNSPALRTAIRSAMEFWFVNDYKDATCMDRDFLPGGQTRCSCATPGMWNTNWYSNVIQVPTRLGKACTLLRSTLSPTELGNCTLVAGRSFAPFFRTPYPGYVSGANVIDMAVIGMSAGLLERNATKIADAYARVREQVTVQAVDRVDGIKPDGSFQQHTGIIYDGNYGKDFSNSLMELELQALGTQFEAPKAVQDVFGLHLGGARWMTFTNILTKVVHWDLTVIGRFVSYPVESLRASANLRMDLPRVLELGNTWNQTDILRFGAELWGEHDKTANSGDLLGTRVFWDSDYMVHRTASTVTTLKMLSNRTTTSECVNSEGPYVFHLSDGVMYSYSTGAEYEDMFATLDWNIPPGITTDYGATPLECGTAAQQGIDTYAGGVVGQSLSVGAMRYVNPLTKSLRFYKAWFFFPDNVQHVLVSDVKTSTTKAPVYSVLDQRLRWGQVVVNGEQVASNGSLTIGDVQTVWHSGTGYAFAYPQKLGLKLETKTGNWRDIGTSKAPLYTKDMFAAWVHHPPSRGTEFAPLEYSIFPATRSNAAFESKAQWRPRTIANSAMVSAAMDVRAMMLGAAFWTPQGGGITINEMGIRIEVDRGVVLVLEWDDEQRTSGRVSVADPSHGTRNVNIRVRWLRGWIDPRTTANPTGLPIPAPFPVPRGFEARSGGRRCALKPRAAFLDGADAAMVLKLPKDGMAGSTIMTTFRRGGY